MGGPWTYEGEHDFSMHDPDKEFFDELVSTIAAGVVGRGMYDAAGAWGGSNPFPGLLFVVTHRTADQPAAEAASGSSRTSTQHSPRLPRAGDGDVSIGRGADIIRQALAAGKVDELVISTAPVILGAGKRLFDGFDRDVLSRCCVGRSDGGRSRDVNVRPCGCGGLATAIVDRLLRYAHVCETSGDSVPLTQALAGQGEPVELSRPGR
jgi:dihydrofolate reductase